MEMSPTDVVSLDFQSFFFCITDPQNWNDSSYILHSWHFEISFAWLTKADTMSDLHFELVILVYMGIFGVPN